ncbi:hypothetical protein J1N35_014168 [Gossypium stocksii]|uniref:Ankyrin repeat domain-containing protein n=1 Tax=Gossypium stocksii TaxID=47602 RepID=A0A9D3VTQ9_9ROSI|nr:hypothetical protein J1N35_014168 [Gossypium stocksii]
MPIDTLPSMTQSMRASRSSFSSINGHLGLQEFDPLMVQELNAGSSLYLKYMGMLAFEGDKPKIEKLLKAGAKYDVKDVNGRTALERAVNEEKKDFILGFAMQKA